MNIFLVGNGYDLHHEFPTGYLNFLHVMEFLIGNYDVEYTTVGDILGNTLLHEKDSFIKNCYERHIDIYNQTGLPSEEMKRIINCAKENSWFGYLSSSIKKDIKWIDFEKEIIRVLEMLKNFFNMENYIVQDKNSLVFDTSICLRGEEDWYILSQFNFFFEKSNNLHMGFLSPMCIREEYIEERVKGSNILVLSKEKIVSRLYQELRGLAKILRDYLKYFVDGPAEEILKQGRKPIFCGMPTPNRVYSFNYTNTIEILYGISVVDHIHGNTNTNIVLGVNPDSKDEIDDVDTTFLQFKKYFQRVFYGTDIDFLKYMKALENFPHTYGGHVWVIGHSLDVTDEDVIKQIFDAASEITVLYHKEERVKDYITHLVEIYGKQGLDFLRREKKLRFLPQGNILWECSRNEEDCGAKNQDTF